MSFLPQLSVIMDPPLPPEGLTQFVAVTRQGLRGVSQAPSGVIAKHSRTPESSVLGLVA
jgi:hypothetical protein